jgi:hypothetical protein
MSCGIEQTISYTVEQTMRCGIKPRRGTNAFSIAGLPTQALLALFSVAILLCPAHTARAQVVPAGYQSVRRLSAGFTASGDTFQYGARKMFGAGVFLDAETSHRLGIEAEGRWVEFHQTASVHAETYSIGGRYRFVLGRWQPYAKAMAGFASFNFPYNYAHGRYLAVTAGGGVDLRWTRRLSFRVADLEYQDWPQFTYGAMTSLNVSAGLKVGIF